MSGHGSSVHRQRIPQLVEAICADDDWTGLTDAKSRRKRQNRLNVRAYRKRKAEAAQNHSIAPRLSTTTATCTSIQPYWHEGQQALIPLRTTSTKTLKAPLLPMDVPAAASISTVIFPLSSDHLIILLQYNVLRGGLQNRQLLDQISTINTHLHATSEATDLHTFPALSAEEIPLLPLPLHPTHLQQTVPYPHWIDILPHPVVRDNLIKAAGRFDPDDLWSDTVGGLFEGFPDDEVEARGMVMWETPWLWEGWELSEGFVKKWAWALGGAEDVLGPTNRWREKRGEERILLVS